MTNNHPDSNSRIGALLAAARSLHDAVLPETAPMSGPQQAEQGYEDPA
jgi:hypothetical protein